MIPTPEELADILLAAGQVGRSKPRTYADLDDDWKEQVVAEVSAVRDAVLEGVANDIEQSTIEIGMTGPPLEKVIADYIRSLKGSSE